MLESTIMFSFMTQSINVRHVLSIFTFACYICYKRKYQVCTTSWVFIFAFIQLFVVSFMFNDDFMTNLFN